VNIIKKLNKIKYHLDWIKLAMQLREERADMSSPFNLLLKEGFLQLEVILLAQKSCHAIVIILKRANGTAFCTHASNVEATFHQCLLEAFCRTSLGGHFLCLATKLGIWIIYRNDSISLLSLCTPI
jgi:hypothetical protein